MKKPNRALPHQFEPGKEKAFPGPYCKFCHYSAEHLEHLGGDGPCPKRKRKPKRAPTDKERLDYLNSRLLSGSHREEEFVVSVYTGTISTLYSLIKKPVRDVRRAIDAAIKASREKTK